MKVIYKGVGKFVAKGIEFEGGKEVEVKKEVGDYLVKTFPALFVVKGGKDDVKKGGR